MGSWFEKWFGFTLIVVGELVAFVGLSVHWVLTKVTVMGSTSSLSYLEWVREHIYDIAHFLGNLGTYQDYALAVGIGGLVVFFAGFSLLVVAGRK